MTNNYPTDKEGNKKLPSGKNFGKIMCDSAEAYYPNHNNIFLDGGTIFVDLEKTKTKLGHIERPKQVHLGVSGNFVIKQPSNVSSKVKPHIDVYIPTHELGYLIMILKKIRGSCNGASQNNP